MRVAFAGTPEFARVALAAESNSNTEALLISAPSGPIGRITSMSRSAPAEASPVTSIAVPTTTMPAISSRISGRSPA
jgi:methionyl-tRNA formyltransferase